jgi:hypothetical protein
MFREIIPVYSENHKKHLTTLRGQNAVFLNSKKGHKYSKPCALNDLKENLNFFTMEFCRSRFCSDFVLARFTFNVNCILISIRLVDGFLVSFAWD